MSKNDPTDEVEENSIYIIILAIIASLAFVINDSLDFIYYETLEFCNMVNCWDKSYTDSPVHFYIRIFFDIGLLFIAIKCFLKLFIRK